MSSGFVSPGLERHFLRPQDPPAAPFAQICSLQTCLHAEPSDVQKTPRARADPSRLVHNNRTRRHAAAVTPSFSRRTGSAVPSAFRRPTPVTTRLDAGCGALRSRGAFGRSGRMVAPARGDSAGERCARACECVTARGENEQRQEHRGT